MHSQIVLGFSFLKIWKHNHTFKFLGDGERSLVVRGKKIITFYCESYIYLLYMYIQTQRHLNIQYFFLFYDLQVNKL